VCVECSGRARPKLLIQLSITGSAADEGQELNSGWHFLWGKLNYIFLKLISLFNIKIIT